MKIHGLACFHTYNGLRAIGSGRLKFANKHTSLFEFGNPGLGGSEYLSANIPTIFVRKFYYRDILAHLVGVVKKTRDKFGRTGFWGVSAMVDDDKPIDVAIVDCLFGIIEFADKSTIEERETCFREVIAEYDDFAPGKLEQYEARNTLVFSIKKGILSDEILQRSKSLMQIEPSAYSTLIIQLGSVANANLGELDRDAFEKYFAILNDEAEKFQNEMEFDNLAPYIKKFIERTNKLGVDRPDIVDAEFEDYLIALIKYVNSAVSHRHRK